MQQLAQCVKRVTDLDISLPFSVFSAVKEQYLVNVTVAKPLLICVLSGYKQVTLGAAETSLLHCDTGQFLFLSNNAQLAMRNIPQGQEYLALLIEFEFDDFACFQSPSFSDLLRGYDINWEINHQDPPSPLSGEIAFDGKINALMRQTLQQFVEWSASAPKVLWQIRRQEILQLWFHQGYHQVSAMLEPRSVSHKIQQLISAQVSEEVGADVLSAKLAMSESTLRRKLQAEGTSLREIRDRVKLGYGLYLIQTSHQPIGRIAQQCGYVSQSRFTDKFKQLLGITPSELRKTRMHD